MKPIEFEVGCASLNEVSNDMISCQNVKVVEKKDVPDFRKHTIYMDLFRLDDRVLQLSGIERTDYEITILMKRIQQLMQDLDYLTSQISRMTTDHNELICTLVDANPEKIGHLMRKNADLASQLSRLSSEKGSMERLKKRIDVMETDNQTLVLKISGLMTQLDTQANHIAQITSICSELKTKIAKAENYESVIPELVRHIENLSTQLHKKI